ncbi:hypothetical protein QAD02_014167 [Eretmocerus hayati]|uniref:Uncharacterized protein n=1 Tax=Eretmocerus hayati TaxID=131215 RepID=A0ACC2P4R7_9HYME|nr:hypothetical protein QAD02_014167 [Eretmocerus hayati]
MQQHYLSKRREREPRGEKMLQFGRLAQDGGESLRLEEKWRGVAFFSSCSDGHVLSKLGCKCASMLTANIDDLIVDASSISAMQASLIFNEEDDRCYLLPLVPFLSRQAR